MAGPSEETERSSAFGPEDAPPPQSQPLVTLAAIAAVIAAFYFLREIFIPIALAVLLSFMLGPAVSRLRRWGMGRVTATLTVVFGAGLAIAAIATVVTFQVIDLAEHITTYQTNLTSKIRLLRGSPTEDGIVERTSELIRDLSEELQDATASEEPGDAPQKPIPVEVHTPRPDALELIGRVIEPLLRPLATTGVVIVFVVFFLLYREDLRDRIIRLISSGDLQRTTEAMSNAGQRVSRYLVRQLIINATYGLPVGIGLYLIGVPNPALWGLLTILLRFIPYAGPVIAASFPIALSFAVDPGWTTPLLTVGLFLGMEIISNNVIEPCLYGRSTGISPIAILVAAVFWTWLWGPIGLLLSTPLTVCLVVIGQYVPQLRFLDVLLGSAPVLPPFVRFYQRLLAQDPDEAAEIADTFLEDGSIASLYDELILPALILAERDRQRGSLTPDRLPELVDTARAVIEDHADISPREESGDEKAPAPSAPGSEAALQHPRCPILCVGARSPLDELAAGMLAQLLQHRGFAVARAAAATLVRHELPTVQGRPVRVVAICSLHASALTQIRRIVRRLRPQFAGVRILAGVFNGKPWSEAVGEASLREGGELVASRLADAVALIERISRPASLSMASMAQERGAGEVSPAE